MAIVVPTGPHVQILPGGTGGVGGVQLVEEFDGEMEAVVEFDGEMEASVEFEGEIDGVAAKNLEIAKGENKTFGFTHRDKAGAIVPLTGATVRFEVRTAPEATSAIITKTSATPAEITIDDATNGHANIFLVPLDTAGQDPEDYVYDVWVIDSTGNENQAVRVARFRILERSTVVTAAP